MPTAEVKRFGIFVKEGLLSKKHRDAIDEAIWVYLFLLNSVTKVEGEDGYVFGGAPFSFDRVKETLGEMSRMTYWRHIDRLERGGYIKTQRAMRGLIVTVTKSYKIFGDVSKKLHHDVTQMSSDVTRMSSDVPNKLHLLDKTIDKTIDSVPLPHDHESLFCEIVGAYNASTGSAKQKIQPGTQRNIVAWLEYYDPDKILEAIRNQRKCTDPFLKDLSFETLFRHSNKTGDADYIGQILANYKL